ncbi:MAG: hypothetical protein FJ104_11280, partial [Deltaproteobacteria bacterium]|nr:hypothetical protein [Deltaproteobacteria bacterium]
MQLATQRAIIDRLAGAPADRGVLAELRAATEGDPTAYVELLVAAAARTSADASAARYLVEAARVREETLRDPHSAARLLEWALERDPLNLRAATRLVELVRSRRDDEELARLLRERTEALRERVTREPSSVPRASHAFERLSGAYEALGDPDSAIAALRTALELERAEHRGTFPSPPPDGPPSSAWEELNPTGGPAVPDPAGEDAPRDTIPSPRPAAVAPTTGGAGGTAPLLAVIEALHELRQATGLEDGAARVLSTTLAAIPCASGRVLVEHPVTRELTVVATESPGASATWPASPGGADTTETGDLGCSVQFDGRIVGRIELSGPEAPLGFSAADREALTYVADRFADFLADR